LKNDQIDSTFQASAVDALQGERRAYLVGYKPWPEFLQFPM
jgi:hypothetical protein